MKKILIRYGIYALAVALRVPLAQSQSQPVGLQAAFAKHAGTLSDKFSGLGINFVMKNGQLCRTP